MKNWIDSVKKKIDDNPEAAGGELLELEKEPKPVKTKKVRQSIFARFRRETKRDRQLATLTDGYQQMVSLMGSIQLHLESQTKSQQHLLNAMENLPEVAAGLKKMGTAAEKQTEVMGLMREQLDSSVQHDKQLVNSMNRFNKTLAAMNGIFLLLLLVAGLSAAVYFMNDSAGSSLLEKARGLFEKPVDAVETVTDAPAAEPAGEPPVFLEGEPVVEETALPAEEPDVPVEVEAMPDDEAVSAPDEPEENDVDVAVPLPVIDM